MTPTTFRRLALNLPEASESAHMGHPDFRVGGKSLRRLARMKPGDGQLMLEQQAEFVRVKPKMFEPINGAWGRRGATKVLLKAATKAAVLPALVAAWQKIAPERLITERGDDEVKWSIRLFKALSFCCFRMAKDPVSQ
jgi:hypothetical protein